MNASARAPVSLPDSNQENLGYATKLIAAHACSTGARGINDIKDVPSPCISVCRVDADSGWCDGCLRTLDTPPHHTTPHHTPPHCTTPYCTLPHCTTPHHTTLAVNEGQGVLQLRLKVGNYHQGIRLKVPPLYPEEGVAIEFLSSNFPKDMQYMFRCQGERTYIQHSALMLSLMGTALAA